MEKTGKESLLVFMDIMAQLRDAMEAIEFHEVATAVQGNYDAAHRY